MGCWVWGMNQAPSSFGAPKCAPACGVGMEPAGPQGGPPPPPGVPPGCWGQFGVPPALKGVDGGGEEEGGTSLLCAATPWERVEVMGPEPSLRCLALGWGLKGGVPAGGGGTRGPLTPRDGTCSPHPAETQKWGRGQQVPTTLGWRNPPRTIPNHPPLPQALTQPTQSLTGGGCSCPDPPSPTVALHPRGHR